MHDGVGYGTPLISALPPAGSIDLSSSPVLSQYSDTQPALGSWLRGNNEALVKIDIGELKSNVVSVLSENSVSLDVDPQKGPAGFLSVSTNGSIGIYTNLLNSPFSDNPMKSAENMAIVNPMVDLNTLYTAGNPVTLNSAGNSGTIYSAGNLALVYQAGNPALLYSAENPNTVYSTFNSQGLAQIEASTGISQVFGNQSNTLLVGTDGYVKVNGVALKVDYSLPLALEPVPQIRTGV
jgi:hypothetical protein